MRLQVEITTASRTSPVAASAACEPRGLALGEARAARAARPARSCARCRARAARSCGVGPRLARRGSARRASRPSSRRAARRARARCGSADRHDRDVDQHQRERTRCRRAATYLPGRVQRQRGQLGDGAISRAPAGVRPGLDGAALRRGGAAARPPRRRAGAAARAAGRARAWPSSRSAERQPQQRRSPSSETRNVSAIRPGRLPLMLPSTRGCT